MTPLDDFITRGKALDAGEGPATPAPGSGPAPRRTTVPFRALSTQPAVNLRGLTPDGHARLQELDDRLSGLGQRAVISSGKRAWSMPSRHNSGEAVDLSGNTDLPGLAARLRAAGFRADYERRGQRNANGSVATGDHVHVTLIGTPTAADPRTELVARIRARQAFIPQGKALDGDPVAPGTSASNRAAAGLAGRGAAVVPVAPTYPDTAARRQGQVYGPAQPGRTPAAPRPGAPKSYSLGADGPPTAQRPAGKPTPGPGAPASYSLGADGPPRAQKPSPRPSLTGPLLPNGGNIHPHGDSRGTDFPAAKLTNRQGQYYDRSTASMQGLKPTPRPGAPASNIHRANVPIIQAPASPRAGELHLPVRETTPQYHAQPKYVPEPGESPLVSGINQGIQAIGGFVQPGIEAVLHTIYPTAATTEVKAQQMADAATARADAASPLLPQPGTPAYKKALPLLDQAGHVFDQFFPNDQNPTAAEVSQIVNSQRFQQARAALTPPARLYLDQFVARQKALNGANPDVNQMTGPEGGFVADRALQILARGAQDRTGRAVAARLGTNASSRGRKMLIGGVRTGTALGIYSGAQKVAEGKPQEALPAAGKGFIAGMAGGAAGSLVPTAPATASWFRRGAASVGRGSAEFGVAAPTQSFIEGERNPKKLGQLGFGAAVAGGALHAGEFFKPRFRATPLPQPDHPFPERLAEAQADPGFGHQFTPEALRQHAKSISDRHNAPHPETGDYGSSFNIALGRVPVTGTAVSVYPERTKFVPGKTVTPKDIYGFIASNGDLLKDPRNQVGTWYVPDEDRTYLDVSTVIPNPERAIALGRAHLGDQIGVFHVDTHKYQATGGSGGGRTKLPPIAKRTDWAHNLHPHQFYVRGDRVVFDGQTYEVKGKSGDWLQLANVDNPRVELEVPADRVYLHPNSLNIPEINHEPPHDTRGNETLH